MIINPRKYVWVFWLFLARKLKSMSVHEGIENFSQSLLCFWVQMSSLKEIKSFADFTLLSSLSFCNTHHWVGPSVNVWKGAPPCEVMSHTSAGRGNFSLWRGPPRVGLSSQNPREGQRSSGERGPSRNWYYVAYSTTPADGIFSSTEARQVWGGGGGQRTVNHVFPYAFCGLHRSALTLCINAMSQSVVHFECFPSFGICFHFTKGVSTMHFHCVRIISISPSTTYCCFSDGTCVPCYLPAFLIPTHRTTQFPHVLWLNEGFFSICDRRVRASNIPHRDDVNQWGTRKGGAWWWWTSNIKFSSNGLKLETVRNNSGTRKNLYNRVVRPGTV